MGIPAMDSLMVARSLRGNKDSWQLKAAYQEIMKLIKHAGSDDIIDVEGIMKARPADMSFEVFMTLKSGVSVSDMIATVSALRGEMPYIESKNTLMKHYVDTFMRLFETTEMPVWNGVRYPEYAASRTLNPWLCMVMGITNTRQFLHDPDWYIPNNRTVMGELHKEISVMMDRGDDTRAQKRGRALKANGKTMGETKADAQARLHGLIGFFMRLRALKMAGVDVGKNGYQYLMLRCAEMMGVEWRVNQELTGRKLGAYKEDFVALARMRTEEIISEIMKVLFWSFSSSAGMESNLWFVGSKNYAMFLETVAGTPVEGRAPEAVTEATTAPVTIQAPDVHLEDVGVSFNLPNGFFE